MSDKTISDLPTPCLVLDRARLRTNIARMSDACARNGVALRPHMKTAKSVDVARLVMAGSGNTGIAVSTLHEADHFARNGIADIQYAIGIVPDRLDRVAAIQKAGATIILATDNAQVARALGEKAAALGTQFHVMIEVDCGEDRAGVYPDSAALLEISGILDQAPGVTLAGIMSHAGHSYLCRSIAEVEAVAEAERDAAVSAAERVRAMGIACPAVSVGSTPTGLHARDLTGVTEMRAGVYMFGDMFQAQIGSCRIDDLAVSVLTEVSGCRPELRRLLVDAGALALSKDRSTENVPNDVGFGLLAHENSRVIAPQTRISRVYQEHGLAELPEPLSVEDYPIGTRLRVFPNHVCMTAAMYERYHVVDSENGDGQEIVAVWPRVNGW